jgi:hypothetical protein
MELRKVWLSEQKSSSVLSGRVCFNETQSKECRKLMSKEKISVLDQKDKILFYSTKKTNIDDEN